MITTYLTTSTTAKYRNMWYILLSAQGAKTILRSLVAVLRVDRFFGSQHLRLCGSPIIDATYPALNDSPNANQLGIAAAFIGNDPIGERRSWSPSVKRKKGTQT
ncbi:MAG: hypothetical protein WBC91_07085 [Phototrophicaceae bacterium]